ncbi:DHH family phosphoesterase [Aeropyrum camini]|uniref:DHH family phosphoesterase n=1 Tax=Aeropyrum camini TaxID=229980 RepID=UPI00130DB99C|nr:bifunctional oligoribonuclease/PAP phosphatase NrnA [Aeropyrum camini]
MAGGGVGKRSAVITHRNADPDAVGAALVIREVLKTLGHIPCLYSPEGVSRLSRKLLEAVGERFEPLCSLDEKPIAAIVVDAANLSQIAGAEKLFETARFKAVIDHHERGSIHEAVDVAVVDPGAGSSSELAVKTAVEAGVKIPSPVATAALGGIVYDTGRFLRASRLSFEAAAHLIALGADYGKVLDTSRQKGRRDRGDLSLRLAKLKAYSRLRVGRACGELLIAATYIGSFESTVAKSLVDEAADVAIAVAERATEFRVSVRVSHLALENGVTAQAIASMLAEKFGGEGGGHDEAGMAHIPYSAAASAEEMAEKAFNLVSGRLGWMCVSKREERR